ncbi:MAG: hypothetical protein FJX45_13550 [Alphaproteobacteria bacterium]|nr:hypothetical protein [Alphaproteobacteria bacterium]MBM3653177.1 hypothetical protein [Alphaproteobacteria bacterium]
MVSFSGRRRSRRASSETRKRPIDDASLQRAPEFRSAVESARSRRPLPDDVRAENDGDRRRQRRHTNDLSLPLPYA